MAHQIAALEERTGLSLHFFYDLPGLHDHARRKNRQESYCNEDDTQIILRTIMAAQLPTYTYRR